MDALVSIIIPVYNLENYIENCLDSLVNQTYKNIEIICVDDGSKDNSGEKIKAMQANDDRIVYIRQDNAGVSAARNNGLKNYHGDYVMFVDGDDYVHHQAVGLLLKGIDGTDYGFVYSKAKNTPKLDEEMPAITDGKCRKSDESELYSNIDGNCLGKAVWGKIYRRATLENLDFPENITNGEDFHFIVRYLCTNKCSIGFVDEQLYYYYQRGDSASQSDFSPKRLTELQIIEKINIYLSDKDNDFLKTYSVQNLISMILVIRTRSINSKYERETKKLCKSLWKKWHKQFLSDKGISITNKIMLTCFYYSRHLYELARMMQDPTMKDFYKNRNK